MKKITLLLLILILILTSCSIGQNNKPEKPNTDYSQKKGPNINPNEGGEGGQDITNRDDVEPDINHIDIEVDRKMTDDAVKNGKEKKDIILNQNNSKKDNTKGFNSQKLSDNINTGILIERYNTKVPDYINVDLRYAEYDIPLDYLLVTTEGVKIFTEPRKSSSTLGSANFFAKVKLEGKVKGEYIDALKTDEWYLLSWMEEGQIAYGYVMKNAGEPRTFRFDKMAQSIRGLEDKLIDRKYGYISNYKDRNGSPPLKDGKAIDEFGIQAYQSAPAYSSLEDMSDFRYFPDGTIVFIHDEQGEYFKVENLAYQGMYWIPKKFISFDDNIDSLNKVVVVDKLNQNQGAFEKVDDKWTLISYTLATTGSTEQNKFETPTGFFKLLEKRDRFYYINDKTKELGGYAPYGTRFTAGAYIHGVPIDYVKKNGENVDPGMREYLFTIGTTPRSHKCVRNYTSHAKFIYDWADVNDTAVIAID
ncbi:L,D-transpeptidase [Brassicibacter mesophilus]|uniref:L,D-transpeptidase n=1 Tax=Brassicibacter mesophilus TaxID=745119 RepID=UPI003D22C902